MLVTAIIDASYTVPTIYFVDWAATKCSIRTPAVAEVEGAELLIIDYGALVTHRRDF